MSRLVIDPITRIGGHLRIEVSVEDGVVTDAWSSGTMFRGMEGILRGRDPRDAWLLAQRTCGVCTGAHALASVRAVEHALGVTPPPNARIVRNLLAGATFVVDHVTGFYHRAAIDWFDLGSALTADPATTARIAQQAGGGDTSETYFRGVRDRLAAFVASNQPGPFSGVASGHPANRIAPEAGLMLLANYLRSLDWARRVARIETILGGKSPHPQTFVVGGMALVPPWGGATGTSGGHPDQIRRNMPTALAPEGLTEIAMLIEDARSFVDELYMQDILRLARTYPEWSKLGAGATRYLSYGEFPEGDGEDAIRLLPGGWIAADEPAAAKAVDEAAITESVAHSWYEPDDAPRHPSDAITEPRFAGPPIPFATLEGVDRYSWLKAPRYLDSPVEVGSLARVLVAYAQGGREVRAGLDGFLATLGADSALMSGTLGRTVARAIEVQVVATRLSRWLSDLRANMAGGDVALADVSMWNPDLWPAKAAGFSLGESSRGALGHWVGIENRRISRYAIVDATTWNASPRDDHGVRGPLEEALIGTPVADPGHPIEILRTVHSFDPCTACAVHVLGMSAGGSPDIRITTKGRRR